MRVQEKAHWRFGACQPRGREPSTALIFGVLMLASFFSGRVDHSEAAIRPGLMCLSQCGSGNGSSSIVLTGISYTSSHCFFRSPWPFDPFPQKKRKSRYSGSDHFPVAWLLQEFPGACSISTGGQHLCALEQATGHVLCWGNGDFGQLGDNLATSSMTPVRVQGSDGS